MTALKIFTILLLILAYTILFISFAFIGEIKKITPSVNPLTNLTTWHPTFDGKLYY